MMRLMNELIAQVFGSGSAGSVRSIGEGQIRLHLCVIKRCGYRLSFRCVTQLTLCLTSPFVAMRPLALGIGYKAVSCACGMACGSWNLRGDSGCHCQCAGIDWTSATCCRIG
ncbi:hypothetical protein lerEdw1_015580 [Lerista edwardsae]|nr:hypothetical protein lerEdw1_015580 [Lerista edwardsae]